MNHLAEEYERDRDAEQLLLEFMQIPDLTPLLPTLQKFKQLKRLSLHGNRLKYLPTDLSRLKELEELDLTNNMFASLDDVLTSLQYIPKLERLQYNLRSEQEKDQCLRMLPGLKELNRQIVRASGAGTPTSRTKPLPTLDQKDLEDAAVLYDRIRHQYRENGIEVDQELAEQFDDTVQSVIKDLGRQLKEDNSGDYIAKTRVLCAKYALTDLCFTKFIGLFGIVDQKFEGILQAIHNNHAEIFKQMAEIILYKQFSMEEKEHTKHVKHRLQMYRAEMERLRKQRDSCADEIAELSLQNERLYEHMVRFGRSPPNTRPAFSNNSNRTPQPNRNQPSPTKKENGAISVEALRHAKKLNLHQLKELINEMFASKVHYDKKCEQSNRPTETLQQYMYTFFNKKYGLKSLTVEWAMGIVNAIRKFGAQDVEVALFGRILRNEVEEQFRDELLQTKEQIDDCFRTQIKRKTQRSTHEINAMLAEKQQSSVALYDVEEVVRYFFSKEDAQRLLDQISEAATNSGEQPSATKQKSPSIQYSALMKLLMDHLLQQHEVLLERFVSEFKRFDQDSDGILSEPEFRNLFMALSSEQQRPYYNEILAAMDPSNNRQITFSRACHLLQSAPVNDPLISPLKV